MIRVGIVDDDSHSRDQLKQELSLYASKNFFEYELEEFDSAVSYLDADREFDILFLDIEMPVMSGMELAQKIREKNQKVVIIFCTNLEQMAINGYSVGALGFIVKPVQSFVLDLNMGRSRTILKMLSSYDSEDSGTQFVIKEGPITRIVKASDIDYVEVRQHYLFYNIKDSETGKRKVLRSRGTMQGIIKQLNDHGFIRCSSSFLVNLRSVTSVSKMNVYIGEEILPIGRTFKDEFLDEFSRYIAKKDWEVRW